MLDAVPEYPFAYFELNGDSVLMDTCGGIDSTPMVAIYPDTTDALHPRFYAKRMYYITFDYYAMLPIPLAPHDSSVLAPWTQIDSAYPTVRAA